VQNSGITHPDTPLSLANFWAQRWGWFMAGIWFCASSTEKRRRLL